jgi:predicted dehydrogenase
MKIGIMSFAHLHAEAYIQNLHAIDGVEVLGIADEDAERGSRFAGLFQTRYYDSYEQLLDDQPDGVIVCSENSKHRPLVEMAATRGVHVLCEKPLATTLDDAQAILNACSNAGVILMMAFPMRFSAPIVEFKQQLDSGALGLVYCMNTTNQGRMPVHERSWFVDPVLAGGGAIMDHTVHLADIMRWCMNSEVVEVYAQANRILYADMVEVETAGLLMLTFQNGVFASVDCSWNKPFNYPTWGGLTMEIISERGLTTIDAFSQNLNQFRQDPPNNLWAYWGSDANKAMIEEFIAAIEEQRQPMVTGEDGYRALEITLAAYQSVAAKQPFSLE